MSMASEIFGLAVVKNEQRQIKESLSLYLSLFYADFLLLAALTYAALLLRKVEVKAMIALGIFKDVNEMNDREMFTEYDKMRKQSLRVKEKYKKYRQARDKKRREEEDAIADRYSINSPNGAQRDKANSFRSGSSD